MSGTYLGFDTQSSGPTVGAPSAPSPLATPANQGIGAISPLSGQSEQTAIDSLLNIINNGQSVGGIGAGFTGTGLRGNIPDVTRGEMNLGPQAGVMKSARDVGNVAATLGRMGLGMMQGPVAAISGLRHNPAIMGVLSNVMNYDTLANKEASIAANGPAMGGEKSNFSGGGGFGDRPDSLSPAEAAAQADAAASTGDTGGEKGDTALAGGGIVQLANGGKIAMGPGGGLDDLIPTTIDGSRAAALSDGEFVVPADVVSMMGDGSTNAGARRLYDLVRNIRDHKTGTTQQAGPLPVGDILKRSMR